LPVLAKKQTNKPTTKIWQLLKKGYPGKFEFQIANNF
jgi:hypothetical protein